MAKESFELGKEFRRLRISQGKDAKKIYEGICLSNEYWRYEHGFRRPRWHILEKLMQRLGENPRKYFIEYLTTQEDREMLRIKDKIKFLLRKEDSDSLLEIADLIKHLESNQSFTNEKLNQQFLLRIKATLAFQRNDHKTAYEYATKGIEITKPNFSEGKIDTYTLFLEEILLINLIAVAHSSITSLEMSADALLRLKKCLDGGYIDEEEKSKAYMHILFNLSNKLGQLGRYDECLAICNTGIEFSNKHENSYFLPLFVFNKACCLLACKEKEEGIALLKDAYAIFKALKRLNDLSKMTEYVNKEFGIILGD